MLVFVVSYLTIFFLLIGMMPVLAPNLLYGGKGYLQSFDVPSYFSPEDIENIKYFEENNLTFPAYQIEYDYNPDINIKLIVDWNYKSNTYIVLNHITWEWWLFWTLNKMSFTSLDAGIEDEYYLGKTELLLAWDSNFNSSIFTAITDSGAVKVKCWFADMDTTRNDIGEAYDEGNINLGIGFGMDDVVVGYSAWNLIGLLLTFQSPEIFGATGIIAITLNIIANSPMYLAIAYLVFYFITSVIPFIRGA